jgi:hypothetical protein
MTSCGPASARVAVPSLVLLVACGDLAAPPDAIAPDDRGECEWPPLRQGGRYDLAFGACFPTYCFPEDSDAPFCSTECDPLDEATCLATDGCQVSYFDGGAFSEVHCHSVAPSGPVRGEPCDGLATAECARHDDCALVFAFNDHVETSWLYDRCGPERTPAAR